MPTVYRLTKSQQPPMYRIVAKCRGYARRRSLTIWRPTIAQAFEDARAIIASYNLPPLDIKEPKQ